VGAYLAGGLVLGATLIVAYVVRARGSAKIESGLAIFLSGASTAAGVKLIAVCATKSDIKPFDSEDRVYIIFGGIALIWVSALAIIGFLKTK
jgi:hypothetical protein